MNYLELLKESYKEEKERDDDLEPYEYLSDHIFDFTTYDGEAANRMGEVALSVCLAITDRNTFDYIKDKVNYANYLNCVNLVFFMDKLEWGTSVRGAWWDLYGNKEFELNSCGLYKDGEQVLSVKFNEKEWGLFIYAMRDFISLVKTI